jgi:hypothetical protein
LQFRIAVNFSDSANRPEAQDFTVELVDGAGQLDSVGASDVSNALFYPPGHHNNSLPILMLNAVRIPLSKFPGVSLQDVRSIRFRFDRRTTGAVLISDIAFVATPPPAS